MNRILVAVVLACVLSSLTTARRVPSRPQWNSVNWDLPPSWSQFLSPVSVMEQRRPAVERLQVEVPTSDILVNVPVDRLQIRPVESASSVVDTIKVGAPAVEHIQEPVYEKLEVLIPGTGRVKVVPDVSVVSDNVEFPSYERLEIKTPSVESVEVGSPTVERIQVNIPSAESNPKEKRLVRGPAHERSIEIDFPENTNIKNPVYERIKVETPAYDQQVKGPAYERIQVSSPEVWEVRKPTYERLEVSRPALDRLQVFNPVYERVQVNRPSLERNSLEKRMIRGPAHERSIEIDFPENTNIKNPVYESIKIETPEYDHQVKSPAYERLQVSSPVFEYWQVPKPTYKRSEVSRPALDRLQVPNPVYERVEVSRTPETWDISSPRQQWQVGSPLLERLQVTSPVKNRFDISSLASHLHARNPALRRRRLQGFGENPAWARLRETPIGRRKASIPVYERLEVSSPSNRWPVKNPAYERLEISPAWENLHFFPRTKSRHVNPELKRLLSSPAYWQVENDLDAPAYERVQVRVPEHQLW